MEDALKILDVKIESQQKQEWAQDIVNITNREVSVHIFFQSSDRFSGSFTDSLWCLFLG